LEFLEQLANSPPFEGATVLLSHVPLGKPEGLCRDGSYFEFYEWGTLRAQNHLSESSTERVLHSVFRQGTKHGGIILSGHDHEGCISVYDQHADGTWRPRLGSEAGEWGVLEVTVRSMMGEYGGNTGMISGTWDDQKHRYNFEFSLCRFAVQHVWWATEIVTYVAAGLTSLYVILYSIGM
jgi:hypothetical protein